MITAYVIDRGMKKTAGRDRRAAAHLMTRDEARCPGVLGTCRGLPVVAGEPTPRQLGDALGQVNRTFLRWPRARRRPQAAQGRWQSVDQHAKER
jgi:hypothetical protein